MIAEPDLATLPNLPQLSPLRQIAPLLWQNSEVVALWVGGSVAHGSADCYSDVDLRVAIRPEALETWKQFAPGPLAASFAATVVGHLFLSFGEQAFLHHLVLSTGDIYDVWVQSAAREVSEEAILIVACRDAELYRRLQEPSIAPPAAYPAADRETVRQLCLYFWINTHKHRKVLHRKLHLLAMTGVQTERALLLRLWYIAATGQDCGEQRTQTIHGLTHLMRTVEAARGAEALRIMGASLASPADIRRAIETLRDAVSEVGHTLVSRFGFPYPSEAEQVARNGWETFLCEEPEENTA